MNGMHFLLSTFFVMLIMLGSFVSAADEGLSVRFDGKILPPEYSTGKFTSQELDELLKDTMGIFQITEKLPYYYYVSYGDVVDFYEPITVSIHVEGEIGVYVNNGCEPLIVSLYEQGGGEAGVLIFDSDKTLLDKEKSTISANFTAANFSVNEHTDGENRAIFVLTFYKQNERCEVNKKVAQLRDFFCDGFG